MANRWLAMAALVCALLVGYASGSRSLVAQDGQPIVRIGETVTIAHGDGRVHCVVQQIRGAFVKCDDRRYGELGDVSREYWLNLDTAVSVRKSDQ